MSEYIYDGREFIEIIVEITGDDVYVVTNIDGEDRYVSVTVYDYDLAEKDLDAANRKIRDTEVTHGAKACTAAHNEWVNITREFE